MNLKQAKLHFVGIGGVGMSGIAELFKAIGASVTGSDMAESSTTDHLKQLGIPVSIGHQAGNIHHADVVVYSSAVNKTNPELNEAVKRGIPLIPRAEALAELMRLKRGIAIAGSHGKTTTTSFVSHIFLYGGDNPTVVVGGRLRSINSGAYFGEGDWLIAEADESDGSFSKLSPEIAVITNIDHDHLDYFKKFDSLLEAFYQFALKIPFYGCLLYCGDAPYLRELFSHFPKRAFSYGFGEHNHYRVVQTGSSYELYYEGVLLGGFQPPLLGDHNILNGVASLIVALRCGITLETAVKGLESFSGVERRLHHLGSSRGVEYYTDYAHHPTEIKACIQAFEQMFPTRRLLVVFQPHRYSRTELCWADFLTCFHRAHQSLITDIYGAGEKPMEGVSSQSLVEAIGCPEQVYFSSKENLLEDLKKKIQPQDVVVFMGAGDIYKIAKEMLPQLVQG
jgi:UDP-N-acetylmuramate--alanine ligase